MSNLYVTFFVFDTISSGRKLAVECKDLEKAKEVASDVYGFDGVKNVRLRRCGKPKKDRKVLSYNQYWKYSTWLYSKAG